MPFTATLVIDSPIARTGQCGEATFTGPPASRAPRSTTGRISSR
jgi:hypothetical protein